MRLLASLLCLIPLLAHIYCKDVFGIVGENFTFPVEIDQKIAEATWKKNKNKVAKWDEQNKLTYFGPLQGRSVLMSNGSLTIVNLKPDDAGTYELHYWDSKKDHYLNYILAVLDSLPEPKISCNTSDGKLALNCTADFQRSLNYAWKLSNSGESHQGQEFSIPLKNVDTTTNATCIIKFSQTERSSEISLVECLPEEKGHSSSKRQRDGLFVSIAIFSVAVVVAILVVRQWRKGKFGKGRSTAQNNIPMNGLGEHEQLFPGNSQQQPSSEGDRALNEEDRALNDQQIVENGVNQEGTLNNSSLLAKHADNHGINEGGKCLDCGAVFVQSDFCQMPPRGWHLLCLALQGCVRDREDSAESGMEVLDGDPMGVGHVGQGSHCCPTNGPHLSQIILDPPGPERQSL